MPNDWKEEVNFPVSKSPRQWLLSVFYILGFELRHEIRVLWHLPRPACQNITIVTTFTAKQQLLLCALFFKLFIGFTFQCSVDFKKSRSFHDQVSFFSGFYHYCPLFPLLLFPLRKKIKRKLGEFNKKKMELTLTFNRKI